MASIAFALCATAGAGPATLAEPVGEPIAVARHAAVADAAGTRIAFELGGPVVRVIDLATSARRDFDVSEACRPPPFFASMVGGLGEGAVLLVCEGPERTTVPRVLDETDAAVKVPVGYGSRWSGLPSWFAPDGRLVLVYSNSKTPPIYTAVDWRTGDVQPWDDDVACRDWALAGGVDGPAVMRCDGSEIVGVPYASTLGHGFVSWMRGGSVGVGLPDCRASLEWDVGWEGRVAHLPGAAVISSSPAREGPWTITRVPLDGVCERTVERWALRAASGRRSAAAVISTAYVPDPATGATVRLLVAPPRRAVTLRAHVGAAVTLRAQVASRSLRWRFGQGAWRNARRASGGAWTLRVPKRLRRTRTFETRLTLAAGGTISHVLRLVPVRG